MTHDNNTEIANEFIIITLIFGFIRRIQCGALWNMIESTISIIHRRNMEELL